MLKAIPYVCQKWEIVGYDTNPYIDAQTLFVWEGFLQFGIEKAEREYGQNYAGYWAFPTT